MPATFRGPDGRYLSAPLTATRNDTTATETTTMPTTDTNTTLASLLATVEASLSDRVAALVEPRVSTVIREEAIFHVARVVPGLFAEMNINAVLREQAATAAREFGVQFMDAEMAVMREVVIENAVAGIRSDTIRDYAVNRVADHVIAMPLEPVHKAAAAIIVENYFYEGSGRFDRLQEQIVSNVVDRLYSHNRSEIMGLVADCLAVRVAVRLFETADVAATASATHDAAARV